MGCDSNEILFSKVFFLFFSKVLGHENPKIKESRYSNVVRGIIKTSGHKNLLKDKISSH